MNIQEYSDQALTTIHSNHDIKDMDVSLLSFVLGLVGESGEVADKFKKLIRDQGGVLTADDKTEILKELGDVLWYVNSISVQLGSSLEAVAQNNLTKVLSRKERGVTAGSGDNR